MGNARGRFETQRTVVAMLMLVPFLVQIAAYYRDSSRLTGEQRQFIAKNQGYGLKNRLAKVRYNQFPYLNGGLIYLTNAWEGLYPVESLQQSARSMQRQHPCDASAQSGPTLKRTTNLLLKLMNTNQSMYKIIFKTSRDEVISTALALAQQADGVVLLAYTHLSDFALNVRSTYPRAKTFSAWYIEREISDYPAPTPESETAEQARHSPDPSNLRNIFLMPVYDAYSGHKLPLQLVNEFQQTDRGLKYAPNQWDVLLDASSLSSFDSLDLSKWPASFVYIPMSQMLGFPHEVHVLAVRADVYDMILSRYASQSPKQTADCLQQDEQKKHACFAPLDSSIEKHELTGIDVGLRLMKAIGNKAIAQHVCSLTRRSAEKAATLKLPGGAELITLVGKYQDLTNTCYSQGGITSFVVNRDNGGSVDPSTVVSAAKAHNIVISSVCSQELQNTALQAIAPNSLKESSPVEPAVLYPRCVLQISYGYQTTLYDVDAFWNFVARTYGSGGQQ